MNLEDRKNLRFLLVIDEDGFMQWCKQADFQDIVYAVELLIRSQHDPFYEEYYKAESLDEIEDVTEAREVLTRFVHELK